MGNRRRKPPKVGDLIYILDVVTGNRIYGSAVDKRGCQVKVWWFNTEARRRHSRWRDRTVISVVRRS